MSFEGPEKRLDVRFRPTLPGASLRSLPLCAVDALLSAAACTRLSAIHTRDADAYLLSESSLFVFRARFLIKTCGTTTLLDALDPLLRAAAEIGLECVFVQYSRGRFLFPELQPETYRSWEAEARVLDRVLGPARAGIATKLGSLHLYVADWEADWEAGAGAAAPAWDRQTLEVCMFGLDEGVMRGFCDNAAAEKDGGGGGKAEKDGSGGAKAEKCGVMDTTARTGILGLLHGETAIDAFDFAPCGYSMNGLVEGAEEGRSPPYYTMHISPEPEASYVSFETSLASSALASTVVAAVELFQPARFSVSLVGALPSEMPADWLLLRRKLASKFCLLGPPICIAVSQRCGASSVEFKAGVDDSLVDPADAGGYGARAPVLPPGISTVARAVCSEYGARVVTCGVARELDGAVAAAREGMVGSGLSMEASDVSSSSSSDSDDAGGACGGFPRRASASNSCAVDVEQVPRTAVLEVVRELALPMDRPVFVIDLGMVERRIAAAMYSLGPAVGLRYAVHCNADPAIIALLNGNGVEFEAASLAEVSLLHRTGVQPGRIIYVSRVLQQQTIIDLGPGVRSVAVFGRSAIDGKKWLFPLLAENGVSVEVRVATDGADDAVDTIAAAQAEAVQVDSLGLDVAPDASCLSPSSLSALLVDGLNTASIVLTAVGEAKTAGMSISIGEHYPGGRAANTDLFTESFVLNLIGDLPRVTVDAGRYIVGPAVTLITSVIGRRCRRRAADEVETRAEPSYNYYLDDGVYGAFSRVVVERDGGYMTTPSIFKRNENGMVVSSNDDLSVAKEATLFGPTCDALDRIWTGPVPELAVGDLVAFAGMGAYAASTMSQFNGFGQSRTQYVSSKHVHFFASQF